MKNLGTMFGYEMKKIWKRPMTWIAVLVFSAGFVWYAPIPFYNYGRTYTFTQPDGTVISREFTPEEQDRFMIEAPRLLSGQPIDEEFFAKAEENIPARLEDFDFSNSEDMEKVREIEEQRDGYFFLVDPTYYGAYRMLGGQNRYLHRLEWFKADVEANNNGYLTEEEIAYWMELEEQIQQPYIYEPTDAPSRLLDVLGVMGMFLPILVALCVCDLFSQEQRARTYPQIFSSRQGCSCLYLAKILAGSATSVLAAAIGIGAVIAASLIRYGPWGWGAAIQLCQYVSSCSFPITARQGILVLTALLLVYALLCGAVISLVSMWSGSGVASLAVGAALVGGQLLVLQQMWILEMMVSAVPLLQDMLAYLPIALVNASVLTGKKLAHFFGLTLNYIQAGILVYLAVTVLLAALCWLGWRRSAAGRG